MTCFDNSHCLVLLENLHLIFLFLIYLPQIIDRVFTYNRSDFNDTINKIRYEYSEKLSKLSNNQYIIDKLPLNFRWIGFIIKAFPEAKILHIDRNPMAVCWSNYKINFRDSGMEFTLSQKDIAEYYVLYKEIMNYWNVKFMFLERKYYGY